MREEQLKGLLERIELLEFKQELLLNLLTSNNRSVSKNSLELFCIEHDLTRQQYLALDELTRNIHNEYSGLGIGRQTLFGIVSINGMKYDQIEILSDHKEFEYHIDEIIPEWANKKQCEKIATITGLHDYLYGETAHQIKRLLDDYSGNKLDVGTKSHQIENSEKSKKNNKYELHLREFKQAFEILRKEFKLNCTKSNELLETFQAHDLTSITKFYDQDFEALQSKHGTSEIKTTKVATLKTEFYLESHEIIDTINNADQAEDQFIELIETIFNTSRYDHVATITYIVKTYRMMEKVNTHKQLSISDCERLVKRLKICNELLNEVSKQLSY